MPLGPFLIFVELIQQTYPCRLAFALKVPLLLQGALGRVLGRLQVSEYILGPSFEYRLDTDVQVVGGHEVVNDP